MIVKVSSITNVINKISDMTSGDKTIPGVLLDLSEDKLTVCYSDGHKSLTEELTVTSEEGDHAGKVVVSYEALSRAIGNCQPSGKICVDEIVFTYKENNILNVSADQKFKLVDNDGNEVGLRKLASKTMDLVWTEPGSDLKSSILIRMNYSDIFNAENGEDVYNRKELIDALSKTSTEKGRLIYISAKTQNIFVANQAHVTSVPVSGYELSEDDKNEIAGESLVDGEFSQDMFNEIVKKAQNRIHSSIVLEQNKIKSLIGVLNKISADNVQVHTKDKFCNIYVDTDEEKVGIWFEMAVGSKANTGLLERYNSLKFTSYQINFIKDFIDDNIKSALANTKNDKISIKFIEEEDGVKLVIACGSASASIADTYKVVCDNIVDPTGDILSKTFNISLKVVSDMLAQIKTDIVAFDFDTGIDGSTSLRVSEVDLEKAGKAYNRVREATAQLCATQGITFEPDKTPTPVELKLSSKIEGLNTKQYAMLAR